MLFGTQVFIDTLAKASLKELYGLVGTEMLSQATRWGDNKPYDVVVLWDGFADAAALNASAAALKLPNGSISFCGTTSLTKAKKGGTLGAFDGTWA